MWRGRDVLVLAQNARSSQTVDHAYCQLCMARTLRSRTVPRRTLWIPVPLLLVAAAVVVVVVDLVE